MSQIKVSHLIWIFILLGLGACSTADKKTNTAAFSQGVKIPDHKELILPNGLRLLMIKDSSLPSLSMMALVEAGSVEDHESKAGLAYLTASLLDEGTAKHSSQELAEAVESLGTSMGISPNYDFTSISLGGLSSSKESLMEIFLEVLTTPQFPQNEIDRIKKRMTGALEKMDDDPESVADQLANEISFGLKAYARPSLGTKSGIQALHRKDVIEFYKRNYRPEKVRLAVVGDFDQAFEKLIQNRLSAWSPQKTNTPERPVVSAPIYPEKREPLYLKSKTGLVQTQIRMVQPLIERANKDYLSLRLANMALGGAFASRLNQKIRDDLGLTYGVSSEIEARKKGGLFLVSTFTRNEKVGETIAAAQSIIREFAEKGLTAEEFETSKTTLIGQFPRAVETMDAMAYQLLALDFYGIDRRYLTEFILNVNRLSLEEVNVKIKKHLLPQSLSIVVYGDKEKIGEQLKNIKPTIN